MAFITPAVLAIGSAVIGVAGTIISTSAALQNDSYQQQIALRQQQVDTENAHRAQYQAQVQQQENDRLTSDAIGSIIAEQGASGLSVNGGSQILTRKGAAILGRRDSLNIRQAGDITAENFLQSGQNAGDAAAQAQAQKGNDLLSGFLGIGKSIIGGALHPPATSLPPPSRNRLCFKER
jgi:hypothetical protein